MVISDHTMADLFMQLGLNSSETSITEFINTHRVPKNERLENASFWTPAQAQFIRESWEEDSDWVEVVDQLNVLLHD